MHLPLVVDVVVHVARLARLLQKLVQRKPGLVHRERQCDKRVERGAHAERRVLRRLEVRDGLLGLPLVGTPRRECGGQGWVGALT